MVKIAILGYGTVGSGVAEVLTCNADSIAQKAGQPIEVARILDIRDFPQDPLWPKFTKDFEDIVNDPEISIVVETMGGLKFAYPFVKACLENGKSVVTSNKELVAAKGDELLEIARKNNLNFLFEASVGGGIPILRPLDQCLAANEVTEIAGILNGTTNFMLTKMIEEDMSFDDALALAQELGYAERDPSADVDGADACRKTCILASLAFGRHVFPEQVVTEGIRHITLDDVDAASAAGGVIKLIGRTRREGDKVYAFVAPTVVPKTSLIADVRDVFNGILVRGNAIGDVVFYGRGAGKLPTASAVVADVIDEVKHLSARKFLYWEKGAEDYVLAQHDFETAWLVRLTAADKTAAKAELNAAFGEVKELSRSRAAADELLVITPVLPEIQTTTKLGALQSSTVVSTLRVADFD
ncbi:MAG: homoserine dehydrogenase [Clostridia bacterium]|nr:homoserine dehydrogenase [Clostridia bacterium]